MIEWTYAERSLLDSGNVLMRRYMLIESKNRINDDVVQFGFWTGNKQITETLSPRGSDYAITTTFKGVGNLIEIDPIVKSAGLSARALKVRLSGASAGVDQVIREYDADGQRIEIFRSIADPATGINAGPIRSEYLGKVSEIAHSDTGSAQTQMELTCYTVLQDLQFAGTGARTHAFQQSRDPSDNGRKHVATVGTWELQWGGGA